VSVIFFFIFFFFFLYLARALFVEEGAPTCGWGPMARSTAARRRASRAADLVGDPRLRDADHAA